VRCHHLGLTQIGRPEERLATVYLPTLPLNV
jgi:hypothetical protein